IIVNGLNLSPHEIEIAVAEVNGVHTAAVAAFATRRPGQATDEVVVIFEPDGALPQDIPRMAEIAHNATALVARRQGLRLAFVLPVESGSLPRTSIGKIQRKTLKDAFENGAFDAVKTSLVAYLASSEGSSILGVSPSKEGMLPNLQDGVEEFLCRTNWLLETHNKQEVLQESVGLVLPKGAGPNCSLATEISAFFSGSVVVHQEEQFPSDVSVALWLDAAYASHVETQDRLNAFAAFVKRLPDTVTFVHVVTRGAFALQDDDDALICPEARALWGFVRSVRQEPKSPALTLTDLPVNYQQESIEALLSYLASTKSGDEAAIRKDVFVPELEPIAQQDAAVPLPIHSDGLYLVTGGAGAVGQLLSQWLLELG
ncbi:MAG: hypothetical protein EBS82_07930, partial [Methylocystaceae bacterium]|nr:hypothetical protein [Methylocystaceae bacterium]